MSKIPGVHYTIAETGWVSYTPTGSWTTNTTYAGKWRRIGDSMELQIGLNTTGTPTATQLFMNIPTGYTIDTTKVVELGAIPAYTPVACGIAYNGAVGFQVVPYVYNTTEITFNVNYVTTPLSVSAGTYYPLAVNIAATAPFTWGNGDSLIVSIMVPIVGWTSHDIISPVSG